VALGLDPFDGERVHGLRLTAEEVGRQIALYQSQTLEERRDIAGLIPERADVILAGACVVATLLRKLEQPATVVSNRGLRHGIFLDRFAQGSE
jgi:exopolyphosphatase/guanosine-5'-triphosphate,3'-diphosphate pyrophosphatase